MKQLNNMSNSGLVSPYYRRVMKFQYWICPNSDKKTGVIKLSVTSGNKESQFSTKIKVSLGDWQSRGSRVKDTDKDSPKKNMVLSAILDKAQKIEESLRQKRIVCDASAMTLILRGIQKKEVYFSENPFLDDLDERDILGPITAKAEAEKLTMQQCLINLQSYKKRRSINTHKTYRTYQSKMREFLAYIERPNLGAADFTTEVAIELVDFMENAEHKPSYIKVTINHYKDALKQAKRRNLIPVNPLADFEYEADAEYNYTYLNSNELTALLSLNNLSDKLQKVRDVLRFMCFTSLHFTDYNTLTTADIYKKEGRDKKTGETHIEWWLEKRRDKTDVEYCQKMHPFAKQIITKYGTVEKLPRFAHRTLYDGIIKLTKLAGIQKHITPKAGRKTFAYICLNVWSYSLETTAKMMGLNKTDTIAYYAKVGRERVDREVNWSRLNV